MISPALRLVAAVGAGAVLVGRPKSGVLHVYAGPLTLSGRFMPLAGRTVCRARTRRLSVFKQASLLLDDGTRRVCARCESGLPAALGRDARRDLGVARGEWEAAFGHLSPQLLQWAGTRCTSVEESHEVGLVASIVHGQKPEILNPAAKFGGSKYARLRPGTPDEQAVYRMHVAINTHRDHLRQQARTDDEVAAAARAREAALLEDQRILKARRTEAAEVRRRHREVNGGFVMPWERRPAS